MLEGLIFVVGLTLLSYGVVCYIEWAIGERDKPWTKNLRNDDIWWW